MRDKLPDYLPPGEPERLMRQARERPGLWLYALVWLLAVLALVLLTPVAPLF